MGIAFDNLTNDSDDTVIAAAVRELVAEAETSAFCRETLLMIAANYSHAADDLTGPKAQALRWAAQEIKAQG